MTEIVLDSESPLSRKVLLPMETISLTHTIWELTVSACLVLLTAWKSQSGGLLYTLYGKLGGAP